MKAAFVVFSLICIGIPVIFLFISIFTNNWQFFYIGILAAFFSSMPTGLNFILDFHEKRYKNKKK
mgnify:CR=1 FL=1|jgi:1,4-dihydroxy-2-naphthoate octaprenyltransferase